MPERLAEARKHLDDAIRDMEASHATWSEAVASLHMAEINLRKAQVRMRDCYNIISDLLHGHR